MSMPLAFFAKTETMELLFVWEKATLEAKAIILILAVFSIFAWSVMAAKGMQMSRAKKMNAFFDDEFRNQKEVMSIYNRRINVDGCPNFTVYQAGLQELEGRLKGRDGKPRERLSLKSMEHVKRALERAVAQEALKLESGLILLAIAVSGGPFLGLLGTVWGVMSTFSYVAMKGSADLPTMAPGVAAALVTTVAGLLVAIPSMFGYNYLVHTLRVLTVGLDNFAQELASRIEIEFLKEDDESSVQ
ncbi:MAG: MotA/TolQ/ExbB proton channel family protein [Verrucomicrobiota bacterium]|nr:MotA/TolQ/ExbB proton channel family protein [Verrucomicrobiota bacterium]